MRKVVRQRIRRTEEGCNIASDVNAVVVSETNRPGKTTIASARQRVRVVQRNRRSPVSGTDPRESP
jgi:hypothetical protein